METIKLYHLESKEKLLKESEELKACLDDMCVISGINEHTDINLFKYNYIVTHANMSNKELKARFEIIDDIFETKRNHWTEEKDKLLETNGLSHEQVLSRFTRLV